MAFVRGPASSWSRAASSSGVYRGGGLGGAGLSAIVVSRQLRAKWKERPLWMTMGGVSGEPERRLSMHGRFDGSSAMLGDSNGRQPSMVTASTLMETSQGLPPEVRAVYRSRRRVYRRPSRTEVKLHFPRGTECGEPICQIAVLAAVRGHSLGQACQTTLTSLQVPTGQSWAITTTAALGSGAVAYPEGQLHPHCRYEPLSMSWTGL